VSDAPEQRRGAGSLLLETWLAAARARGARSFHVGVNRMSVGALRFWEARGVCGSDFRQGDGKPDLLDGARSRWTTRSRPGVASRRGKPAPRLPQAVSYGPL